MTPEIPPAELDRLQPLVDRLLDELRQRTQDLAPESESALTYNLPREPSR